MLFDSLNPESTDGDSFSFKLTQITAKSKSEPVPQKSVEISFEQGLSQFDKFV